jgi:hypothetical protein
MPTSETPPPADSPESPRDPPESSPASFLSHYVELITESLPVTILMSLFTIWALFSDDIRLAATTKEADMGFMIVISIAFILFSLELLAGCIYKENYLCLPDFKPLPQETLTQKIRRICTFGSFYFWLDLIATVSLIFEVPHPTFPFCAHLLLDQLDHRRLARNLKPEQSQICSCWKSFSSWGACWTNRQIGSNGEALQILH